LKLSTVRHEASRGLSATAGLLVMKQGVFSRFEAIQKCDKKMFRAAIALCSVRK